MIALPAFNTLIYIKKLREAGMPEKQAEVQAEALVSIIEDKIATKQDIALVRQDMAQLETGLRKDMTQLETGLRKDINQLGTNVRLEIDLKCAELKSEIMKWVLTVALTQTSLIMAFIGLMKFLD